MKLYLEKDESIWQQLMKYKSIENHAWKKYLKRQESHREIYSNEGIYQINPTTNKIYQLKEVSKSIVERKPDLINGLTLLVDKTNWQYEETMHLPFDHISMEVTTYTFSLFELKQKRIQCILQFMTKRENQKELYDFYFEARSEIDEAIVKEEIIEFLSCLR
jgi:hypothetical protein